MDPDIFAGIFYQYDPAGCKHEWAKFATKLKHQSNICQLTLAGIFSLDEGFTVFGYQLHVKHKCP